MPSPRLNKRILIFADESIVGSGASVAVGVFVVAARDLPQVEFEVLKGIGALSAPMSELHAVRNSASLTRLILGELSAARVAERTVRVLASVPAAEDLANAYLTALRKGAVAALKLYKKAVLRSQVINNADLYVDEVSMSPHIDLSTEFARIIQQNVGSFKAIRKIVPIDSAISRSLQFADAIAYSAQPGFGASPSDYEAWGIMRV